jgi:hypothetical protein
MNRTAIVVAVVIALSVIAGAVIIRAGQSHGSVCYSHTDTSAIYGFGGPGTGSLGGGTPTNVTTCSPR